jgi:hypothetical protein
MIFIVIVFPPCEMQSTQHSLRALRPFSLSFATPCSASLCLALLNTASVGADILTQFCTFVFCFLGALDCYEILATHAS